MKKLYVGNFGYDTTEEQLKELFAAAGTVVSAVIIKDKHTERSKGFGFVEMTTDEEAAKAIADLNGKDLGGRAISVAEARPMRERGGGGGGRDRY